MSQPPAVLTGESEPAEWKTQSAVEPIDEDDPFDPTAASAPPDSARAELPEPAASSSSAAALSPAGPIQGESDGAAVSQQAGSQQLPTASSGPLSLDDLLALTESCGKNLNLLQMSLRPSLQRAVRAARILDGAEDVLLDFSSQGQDPLNLLDPATHSLMLLFLITARSRAIRHADQLAAMIQLLEVFIARADIAQLLLSPDRVTMLAQAIVHVGELAKDPAWALNVLTVLFHRYVGEARLLTALHPIVLAQCIKAGAYDAALRTALRYPVEDVDPMFSPVRFPDVLQYFYYAGIVAAKLEHYPSAIDYFEQCVTTPAQSTSPIQTDAFKKLVLIQLLHDGKTPVLPEYTSAAVSRTLATSCRTYLSFAKLFEDRHATDAEVYHKAEEVKDVFQKDQNWPLAQQVLNTYRSRRIQRLSATYSCITLVEIAHLLGMSDTVETIQSIHEEVGRMIAAGWIDGSLSFANIPQSPTPVPILYFYSANPSSTPSGSGGSKFADIPSITHIQAQLLEAQALKAEVEDRERKMARSAAFLQKQMSSNGGYSGGGQRAGGAGGSSVDSSGFGISGAGGASIGAGGRVTDAYGMPVDDEELDDAYEVDRIAYTSTSFAAREVATKVLVPTGSLFGRTIDSHTVSLPSCPPGACGTYGLAGHGSFLVSPQFKHEPRRLPLTQPLPLPSLRQAIVALEWGSLRDRAAMDKKLGFFERLVGDGENGVEGGQMVQGVRSNGSAALNFSMVAAGTLDCYHEVGVWIWDICAGLVIAREAGGVMIGSKTELSKIDDPNFFDSIAPEVLQGRKYLVIRAIGDTAEEKGRDAQIRTIKAIYGALDEWEP